MLVTQVKSTGLRSSGRVGFLKIESGKAGTDRMGVMNPGQQEKEEEGSWSCVRPFPVGLQHTSCHLVLIIVAGTFGIINLELRNKPREGVWLAQLCGTLWQIGLQPSLSGISLLSSTVEGVGHGRNWGYLRQNGNR